MPKKKRPSYLELQKAATGEKSFVPINRAARRAYQKMNGHTFILPPVMMPRRKPKDE
jgi:hypothetical protein